MKEESIDLFEWSSQELDNSSDLKKTENTESGEVLQESKEVPSKKQVFASSDDGLGFPTPYEELKGHSNRQEEEWKKNPDSAYYKSAEIIMSDNETVQIPEPSGQEEKTPEEIESENQIIDREAEIENIQKVLEESLKPQEAAEFLKKLQADLEGDQIA